MSEKNLPRTTRPRLIKAMVGNFDSLPQYATIDNWCIILEKCFSKIGMKVYCHKTIGGSLRDYATSRNEINRYEKADLHCDAEEDIKMLNSDVADGGFTDEKFPRPERSIFFIRQSKPEYICVAFDKLRKIGNLEKSTK